MTPMGLLANAKLWATSKLMRSPGGKEQESLGEVEVSGVNISTQTAGVSKDTQTEDEPKEKEKPKMLKDLTKEENMSVAEKFDLNEGALPFDRFPKNSLLKTNVLNLQIRRNILEEVDWQPGLPEAFGVYTRRK